MSTGSTTYLQSCYMKPGHATLVLNMIAFHKEFSAIQIAIHPYRKTDTNIPEGTILVTFEMPFEGVDMRFFYQKTSEALNPAGTRGGKERQV